ncbi:DUF3853 family protein [Chryseobacterium sp. A301]
MEPNAQDYEKYIWQLTVAEYIELHREMVKEKKYEYGYSGLAKVLGCGRSTAYNIKASGVLDEAISQQGKIIVVDVEHALRIIRLKNVNIPKQRGRPSASNQGTAN